MTTSIQSLKEQCDNLEAQLLEAQQQGNEELALELDLKLGELANQYWNQVNAEIDNNPAPAAGTWADIARIMARDDDSGFDWDSWKDQMKEGDF